MKPNKIEQKKESFQRDKTEIIETAITTMKIMGQRLREIAKGVSLLEALIKVESEEQKTPELDYKFKFTLENLREAATQFLEESKR